MKKWCLLLFPFVLLSQQSDFAKFISAGDARYSVKSYKDAFLEYDKAYQLITVEMDRAIQSDNPGSGVSADWKHCLVRHAQTAYYCADFSTAEGDADKLLRIDSVDQTARAIKGGTKYKSGEKTAGCLVISQARAKSSVFVNSVYDDCFCWTEGVAQYREAISALNLARNNEAVEKINNAITLLPDSVNYLIKKGEICLKVENYPLAFTLFHEAVQRDSSNFKAWYLRGYSHLKAGRADQAFKDLSKCIDLNPYSLPAFQLRAEICQDLQQYQSAIYDYQQCLKLDKLNGEIHYRMGLVRLNDIHDEIGACDEFSKAAALGYEHAFPYTEECKNPKKKKKK